MKIKHALISALFICFISSSLVLAVENDVAFHPAPAVDPIQALPSRVKKITLKNGLRILVLERHIAPTVSFAATIRTGGLDDETGKSGLAHMFEHMLFKGTKTIGTKDFNKENKLIDLMDQTQLELQSELDSPAGSRPDVVKQLREKIASINKQHEELLVNEEFWQIYERAGGQGLNASTGFDFTDYVISLPVNQIKLWMMMESDRIKNPVLREFYKERDVVMEERRMRVDTSPNGKLWENFLSVAFMASPYGRPILGWESEISRVTRPDAIQFFKKHYDISRLVISVVGDVKAEEIEALFKKYFEDIPGHPSKEKILLPIEPEQTGERRLNVEVDAEPNFIIGYHRPDMNASDAPALDVLSEILGSGRTSRFYMNLVEKTKVASSIWCSSNGPGEREPNLFLIGGAPLAPHSVRDVEEEVYKQIEEIKQNGPTDRELEKVKKQLRASMIEQLNSNSGVANQLAYYEALSGDWKKIISIIEGINKVTALDIQRVAKAYLTESNRTVGAIVRKKNEKK